MPRSDGGFSSQGLKLLIWSFFFVLAQLPLGSPKLGESPSALAHPRNQIIDEHPLSEFLNPKALYLKSGVALVKDRANGVILYDKESEKQRPIASLTKLMTAMVTLDAKLPLDEVITITKADRDRLRGTGSKLSFGTKISRRDLLNISLAASENRAAAALGRTYPGGTKAFVAAMNKKAKALGLTKTKFRDPAGLDSGNVSTARDLLEMVEAAYGYPMIRDFTTTGTDAVTDHRSGYQVKFLNTNRLVRSKDWNVAVSKTGYIAASGHCLVMLAEIADRPIVMVLLNSWGELTKFGDANRVRKWLSVAERKAERAARASSDAAG